MAYINSFECRVASDLSFLPDHISVDEMISYEHQRSNKI